jgi:hypothetical protein
MYISRSADVYCVDIDDNKGNSVVGGVLIQPTSLILRLTVVCSHGSHELQLRFGCQGDNLAQNNSSVSIYRH